MTAKPTHVAILDDDPAIRTALGRFLKATGMVVNAYATGDQFFDSIAQECPDCLLLDLQMPGMSGLDVLKHLGQLHIGIPVIIVTGQDEKRSCESCMNAGAVAYLRKPLDTNQLVETIENVCGKQPREWFPPLI